MNVNTIVGYSGGTLRNQIKSQTLAAVTETFFVVNTDGGTATAVLAIPAQTAIVGSSSPFAGEINPALLVGGLGQPSDPRRLAGRPYFNSKSFDNGKPFLVRLAGVATPTNHADNTLNLQIYLGAGTGTAIAATGAAAGLENSTAAGAFIIEAELIWDSVGTVIGGQQWYMINAGSSVTYNTWKALAANPTAAAVANLQFSASATWGNAGGGVVAVSEFSITQL